MKHKLINLIIQIVQLVQLVIVGSYNRFIYQYPALMAVIVSSPLLVYPVATNNSET